MNILLAAVNAKYIHTNLAVRSLRAYARKMGYPVQIAEYTVNQQTGFILEELYRRRPDVLLFSCYIWNVERVREIAEEFHKVCPFVPIWAGGPEVSFEAGQFLRDNPAFTGLIVGEGEYAFARLCGYYCRTVDFSDIRGIVWRMENGTIGTAPRERLPKMDELPFAYTDAEDLEHRILYYESSRGCPFSCSYCLSSVEEGVRFRSLGLVCGELQFFLDRRVSQVKFVDRTFNCNHAHATGIWKYLLEHDNGITNFHFEIAADLLNEEELQLLARMRPGAVQLEIGVQTTNPETIYEIHRRMRLSAVEDAVCRIREAGNIHQHLDLIAGLPSEDYPTFRRSFNEVYAWKPQQLQLGFLKALKGSYLYEHAQEYGLVTLTRAPYEVLATRWLAYGELIEIHAVEEMLEIHYNSGQFVTSLPLLEECFENAFAMYLQMAEFYRECGYVGKGMNRLQRTEAFLEFARRVDAGREALYQEALTFDLYRIEKAKKRPAWAPDQKTYRRAMSDCLRREGMDRKCCHLEPFSLLRPGCIPQTTPKGQTCWVLFDYEHRDPLTNSARVRMVKWEES